MPRTLLIADDSITIQKVVAITFAAEDFTVVAVDNGEDAVAKARELRPTIVLADVVMPRRNGYEVAQAIKSDPELASIPVLLLAGTFEPFDPAKASASKADGHIVKPFDSQALIDKVGELLGGAPAAVQPAVARPAAAPAFVPAQARQPVASAPSGMPQRPQPIGTPLSRPAPLSAPPLAAPQVVAAPPVARPGPAPLPLSNPLTAPLAPAPMPLRPAATAAPLPLRPAPLPLTQPVAPAPLPLTQRAPLPLTPSPLPLTQPMAPASPLSGAPAWGDSAAFTPAAAPLPTRAPAAPPPSQAPRPLAPTPAWGINAGPNPSAIPSPAKRDPFGLGQPPAAAPKPVASPAISQMAEAAAAASVKPSAADIDVPIDYEPSDSSEGFELGSSQDFISGGANAFTSGSLADLSQQGAPSSAGAIELSDEGFDEPMQLASPHEFLGGPPTPAAPKPMPSAPPPKSPVSSVKAYAPTPAPPAAKAPSEPPRSFVPMPAPAASANGASAGGDGEAALRLALSQASREVIERVVWEVVPQLAETIVREHVERLAQQRSGK